MQVRLHAIQLCRHRKGGGGSRPINVRAGSNPYPPWHSRYYSSGRETRADTRMLTKESCASPPCASIYARRRPLRPRRGYTHSDSAAPVSVSHRVQCVPCRRDIEVKKAMRCLSGWVRSMVMIWRYGVLSGRRSAVGASRLWWGVCWALSSWDSGRYTWEFAGVVKFPVVIFLFVWSSSHVACIFSSSSAFHTAPLVADSFYRCLAPSIRTPHRPGSHCY
jgi:hypothetical protein